MSHTVRQLERDVEDARARLQATLSTLSSPQTYASFKSDLRAEANSTFSNIVDELKARAAANPAATLAIGAGVAWRVIERPPIAATLIGAGLFSLLRTTPAKRSPFQQRDYLDEGRARLKEQVGDFTSTVGSAATDAVGVAREHAETLANAAAQKAQAFASSVATATKEQVDAASDLGSEALSDAREWARNLPEHAERIMERASDTISDQESRNSALLGVAGLAVAAALAISFRRAMADD